MPIDHQDLDNELHRIAVTCIVYREDGKMLIIKRAAHKKVKPNRWGVPGGGLHVNDYIHEKPSTTEDIQWYHTVERTLQREMKEEVGLEVGKPEYLLDITFIRPDKIPVLVLSFSAPYIGGEVKLDEDSSDFAWVTAKEAKNYDMIEGIADELEMVEKKIGKK